MCAMLLLTFTAARFEEIAALQAEGTRRVPQAPSRHDAIAHRVRG